MEFSDCQHLGAAHRSLSLPSVPPRCQAKLLLWVSCPPGLGALLPGSGKFCSFSFNKWRMSPMSGVSTAMLVGSHSLLQGIFPTQESNPGLQHCRWILYHLRHQGGPHACPGLPKYHLKKVLRSGSGFPSSYCPVSSLHFRLRLPEMRLLHPWPIASCSSHPDCPRFPLLHQ